MHGTHARVDKETNLRGQPSLNGLDNQPLLRPTRVDRPRAWAAAARVATLALSDAVALFIAGTVAFLAWAEPVRNQDPGLYLGLAPVLALVLLGYAQAGLYPGFGLGPVETLRRYSLTSTIAFVGFAALTFALKTPEVYSRVTIALMYFLSLVLVPALRHLTVTLVCSYSWWPERVLLFSDGRRPDLMRRFMAERPRGEFIPVTEVNAASAPAVAGLSEEVVAEHGRGIRLVFADLNGPQAEASLGPLRMLFPRVIVLREFEELPVEGVQVRNLGGVLGLEYSNNLLRRQSRWVKRALDLYLGSVLLVVTLPLAVAAIVLVKLKSHGPALFVQVREGRLGRPLRVPKIRTMWHDAEPRMEEYLARDTQRRAEWESSFKLLNDPRVVPGIGRILRRFSIDELPQLWSVVRGDMSLVGPRPFPAYHLDALSREARELRSQVRPGLTGLWQVTARGVAGVEAQQAHDIYYIRNWSLWLDLYILARTALVVLSGKGAY